jgi:hypothetical protein
LQLIRPSASESNPKTAALRAEVEGLRLALSLTQEAPLPLTVRVFDLLPEPHFEHRQVLPILKLVGGRAL